jgi:hypothetical protein
MERTIMKRSVVFMSLIISVIAVSQNSLENWTKAKENVSSSNDAGAYPLSEANGKLVVSDFVDFTGLTSEQIFVNALLYAIDAGTQERENIESVEFETKRFVVKQQIKSALEMDIAYKYSTRFQVAEDNLSFLSFDIVCESKNIFKESKGTPFEKLDTKKKTNHNVYIDEFTTGNSLFLSGMFEFIQTNQYSPITHWDEISQGKIVKGMSETECKLSAGKPVHIRNTGSKVRWMFNNDFIVLFENGVVSSVLR